MKKYLFFQLNPRQQLKEIRTQFSELNPNDPSEWPLAPRFCLLLGLFFSIFAFLWYLWLDGISTELDLAEKKEIQLKQAYQDKLIQAIQLDALKRQLEEVRLYVNQLEKQLPSKAEMDALLSDINHAGIGRSLQFELFRPSQVIAKEYYAELPIAIRITGRYHDLGMFSADIAHLSRIVTLQELNLIPLKDKPEQLLLEGIAKTYRYLDQDEVENQRKIKQKLNGTS